MAGRVTKNIGMRHQDRGSQLEGDWVIHEMGCFIVEESELLRNYMPSWYFLYQKNRKVKCKTPKS